MTFRAMLWDGRRLIVLAATRMGGHTLALAADLHGGHRRPDLRQLSSQRVRHTVVLVLELDVIVDVDARRGPLVKLVPFRRRERVYACG